jgi:hypothetical protein
MYFWEGDFHKIKGRETHDLNTTDNISEQTESFSASSELHYAPKTFL